MVHCTDTLQWFHTESGVQGHYKKEQYTSQGKSTPFATKLKGCVLESSYLPAEVNIHTEEHILTLEKTFRECNLVDNG